MALVPATIDLDFISQYNGPHRVCYRIQGSGDPYTCTSTGNHPNCPGGGLPCAYSIDIEVDNETCSEVTYEGYVQPTCFDESSEDGRVPFTVTFVPSPNCEKWDVECNNAPVASLTLIDGGSGYAIDGSPTVTISGAGGTGATGTVTVGQGEIQSLAITNAGAGYTDGSYTGVSLTGGSGSGGTADITISGGIVTVATINNAGTGYQDSDSLGIDNADVGNSTPSTPAVLTPTTDYGIITNISLTASGSGYTSEPSVVIDSPSGEGSTATASATLEDCDGIPNRECDTIGPELHAPLPVGTSVAVCYSSDPSGSYSSQYVVTEDGNCLCNCRNVTFENTGPGGSVEVVYYNCDTEAKALSTLASGETLTVCVASNSYTYTETGEGSFSVTDNSACDGVS